MPEPTSLLVFCAAALVLIVVPGPNIAYLATRTIAQGRASGVASALGVETGTLIHVAVAAVGLSALLASSATAFTLLRFAGAAYLVVLGVRALLVGDGAVPVSDAPAVTLRRAYAQAVLVQVLNPKVALFFLAFLPQFVDPERGPVSAQILVLGVLLGAIGLVVDLLYVLAADAAGRRLQARPALARRQRTFTGVVYLVLGALAARA